jgi:hypothetical protein
VRALCFRVLHSLVCVGKGIPPGGLREQGGQIACGDYEFASGAQDWRQLQKKSTLPFLLSTIDLKRVDFPDPSALLDQLASKPSFNGRLRNLVRAVSFFDQSIRGRAVVDHR